MASFPAVPTEVANVLLTEANHDAFADIWQVIRRVLGAGWEPHDPAEAAAILERASRLIHDPLTDGQPPDWQYNLGAGLQMLRRIVAADAISLTDALTVIRLHLVAHRWHVEHYGHDRLVDGRWRFLDLMARLVMEIEPTEEELALIARPSGGTPPTLTPGQLIRQRRKTNGWTQEELARRLGTNRSAIGHWEADRHRPHLDNAYALARHLGGNPTQYLA